MSSPGDDSPSDTRLSEPSGDGDREQVGTDADRSDSARDQTGIRDWVETFMTADSGTVMVVREMATSAGGVLLIGLLLFAISGIWPPMVAVESGSMEPHMEKGDLIFIMEEHRFPSEGAHGNTGVTTHRTGQETGYKSFGEHGDVIIYRAYGGNGVPIIHRARFWVDKGENWYDKANKDYVQAENCQQMDNCPAPHAGFITKGDANSYYDQVEDISNPVKPAWITGTAELRIPWLGWIRLQFAKVATASGTPAATGTVEIHSVSLVAPELPPALTDGWPSLQEETVVDNADGQEQPSAASRPVGRNSTAAA